MIIDDIQTHLTQEYAELTARVNVEQAGVDDFDVWYRFPREFHPLAKTGDPFLAPFLVTCMFDQQNLHINGTLSKKLLKTVQDLQKVYSNWFPVLHPISISSSRVHETLPAKTAEVKCASFLSGGIDAWYTLMNKREDIDILITIDGLDLYENQDVWSRTLANTREIARFYQKQYIPVSTNIRWKAAMHRRDWGKKLVGVKYRSAGLTLGGVLSSVGYCLQQDVSRLLIPSSVDCENQGFYGSDALIDPLWSTENLRVLNDGYEASRFEKIETLIKEPLFLSKLRVCGRNLEGQYNCCRCEKCTRVMIALRLLKCLNRAETFPKTLDLNIIKRIDLKPIVVGTYKELLNQAISLKDTNAADALRITLGKKFSFYRLRCQGYDRFMKSKFYYFLYKCIPQRAVKRVKGMLRRFFKWDIDEHYNRIA